MAQEISFKVTVVLKDFSEQFYEGFGDQILGFNQLDDRAKFEKCKSLCNERRATMKIGNGQFRDQVEFNQMLRGATRLQYTLELRRGYRLATFIFTPGGISSTSK